MKTAISVPDAIFKRADKLAQRLKKSRSQLYSEAMDQYLDRHDGEATTEAINKVIEEFGHEPDEFVNEAARRTLERAEW